MTSPAFTQLPGNVLQNLYANGCAPSYTSANTVTIGTGQVRDSTNSFDIAVTTPLVINFAANGANGLDTGTFAASTPYYLFVLYDETQTNAPVALASLSATAPIMPSLNGITFSYFRMVGFVLSDASTNILKFYVSGGGKSNHYQWDAPIRVLNGGVSTTPANISLGAAIPISNFGRVQLESIFIPNAGSDTANIKPNLATAYTFSFGGPAAGNNTSIFEIIPTLNAGIPTLTYQVTAGTDSFTLYVTGFELLT
jgi:hypothetical protein